MSKNTTSGLIEIDDHSLVLIRGADAKKFLQGQVSCDVEQLTTTDAAANTISISSLGAHCTPKGRMLFSFRVCEWDKDTLALSIYRHLIPHAINALKKYSIFSKVELIDASEHYQLLGVIDDTVNIHKACFPKMPTLPNQVVHTDTGVIIAISKKRFEIWHAKDRLSTGQTAHFLQTIPITANAELWTQYQVNEGIAEVRPETVEKFIPQMLNYQSIGTGISFKKGCYTGQEVVARMTYLGKLKRRLYRFSYPTDTPTINVGDALYTHNTKQSIGHIVLYSALDDCHELLAVVTETAAQENNIFLDEHCRLKLQVLPLPYAIT